MSKDKTTTGKALLENAYALGTPEDNKAYYRGFAETYDTDFAMGLGYTYPQKIAETFQRLSGPADWPVADIGCGTGLVAVSLPEGTIDGMDISPEMLAKAKATGRYRDLFEIDLTKDLAPLSQRYGGVVSAGTFTHGHLGPEVLVALLGIARPGALFVIGINAAHMQEHGFLPLLTAAQHDGSIRDLAMSETRIYERDDHEHSKDMALIVTFRNG